MEELTPRQIVAELDRYIIGQDRAKRMVAIALRNRTRRRKLAPELREDISPKNIIMIGPTGCGKTEIARRLARLANAPFIKVEATKYTEVGYVGRDVESMVRELTDKGISMVKAEKSAEVKEKAEKIAEDRILDALLPPPPGMILRDQADDSTPPPDGEATAENAEQRYMRNRAKMQKRLRTGKLDTSEIEVQVQSRPEVQVVGMGMPMGGGGFDDMGGDLRSMLEKFMPGRSRDSRVPISRAREIFTNEALDELLDMDKIVREAIDRVQESGIIFLDEIDKIAGRSSGGHGPDVSREGVQRDILPIVEGSVVGTKYGPVRTDHILFIAAGAFHMTKPSDLIPELQGRFPLRVELDALTAADFQRILTEPQTALTKQYQALLQTEGVEIEFTEDGIAELARSAFHANQQSENIGARRLHTIMEKVLEELSFEAGDCAETRVVIDAKYVSSRLSEILKNQDLSKFIL